MDDEVGNCCSPEMTVGAHGTQNQASFRRRRYFQMMRGLGKRKAQAVTHPGHREEEQKKTTNERVEEQVPAEVERRELRRDGRPAPGLCVQLPPALAGEQA
jgi:hypothetical protein